MNEEDLVASFKSIGRFKSSDLASLSTIDDPAHKLIKHSEEQEPGEIVNKNNEIVSETLNATLTTNSNSDEVILENNEMIKIDQDGSSATSTPYIKQKVPPTLNKVDRLIQEAMNKYSSPNTSVVTATSSTPTINFKNLTKSTPTPGIKLKIKDNSIVEDSSSNKAENETSNKPIESFNLVIKKNPDSSSSVIIKQAAAAAAAQANQTTTPTQNLNKNQQFIPKLKISNSANKQIPDSGHNSAVLNFFNNEILKKDNKIDKQSIQALKIKPIIIGSGDEMNDKGNSKDSSFSDKQYQKNRFDEIDQADLMMTSSSSMKLNFDDDENAMDGVESKKYFSSNNNKPNEPLIWKPVFNDSPQSTNNNNNNNEKQKSTLAPPPPIAPFTIKPKQLNVDLNAKKIAKNNENKISIVDYSSNSNESNSNSHQSNNKKLVETETISTSSSNNKVNSKDDQSTEKNENTGETSKEKHKKKKKNKDKDKDKDKKHHHHHHGEKKDKSNTDELQHASSPSSTASSTKKKDKKEKKELKKQQKKLEKAGMINSETSIDEKNISKTNEEISNDQQLKMNKVNQIKKVFILSIFKILLYLTKYLHILKFSRFKFLYRKKPITIELDFDFLAYLTITKFLLYQNNEI